MEHRIRELCQQLLSTQDEVLFHTLAEELRQALHQHVEELRYAAQQLEVANHLLEPAADLNTASTELSGPAPGVQASVSGELNSTHSPSTVVIQLPSKSKRKSRRSPPNAA